MSETVYIIETNIDNRVYIGCSVDVRNRLLKHQSSLRGKRHTSVAFQQLYNEHSEILILKLVAIKTFDNRDDARKYEKQLLATTPNILNTRIHSSGGNQTKTPEQRKRRSEVSKKLHKTNYGFQDSLARGTGPRNPNYKHGRRVRDRKCPSCGGSIGMGSSECVRCYDKHGVNNPFYGKTHSEETRKLLSEQRMGIPNLKDSKEIVAYGKTYVSLTEAARLTGIHKTTLSYRARSENCPDVFYTN